MIALHDLSLAIAATCLPEYTPPYITRTFPSSGGLLPLGHPILFYVRDDGSGIDLLSFWTKVNGVTYKYGDPEVKLEYSTSDYRDCVFSVLPTGLKWNDNLNVEVSVFDRLGNPGLIERIE